MKLYNAEMERSLLGAVIINPNAKHELDIEPSDFYVERHQWIWEAIDGGDIGTITDTLRRRGKLDEIGGPAYITRLLNEPHSAYGAKRYADIVKDYSRRRNVVRAAESIANAALDTDEPLDVSDSIDKLYQSSVSNGNGATHWRSALTEYQRKLEERRENPLPEVWGLSFGNGFSRLDKATGGAQASQLWLLAGPPGKGKSMIAKTWVKSFMSQAPGAIYSMEMPSSTWITRLLADMTGIETRKLKRGSVNDREYNAVQTAIQNAAEHPVFISDYEAWDSGGLRADLTRLKQREGIKWVVVDYVGLLEDAADDEIERSAKVAKRLRKAARALSLHTLAIASVTKAGFSAADIPSMEKVRGSGQVLHEGDVVLWLHDFLPVTESHVAEAQLLSDEQRDNMRTLFCLKGRELPNPNIHAHLAWAHDRPALAETRLK